MLWFSRDKQTDREVLVHHITLLEQRVEQLQRSVDATLKLVSGLPLDLVHEVRAAALADVVARATVRMDAELQPLSIDQADKQRVKEARERERAT